MTTDQEQSWEDLALLSQEGDKRAYSTLLRSLTPYIYAVLSQSVANPEWADDIVQDVLVSVHKSLKTYSADRPFKPWLRSIIQFRKTDFLRQHYKRSTVRESAQANSEIHGTDVTYQPDIGELKDIEAAIASFPKKQQIIFKMLKIEGYSAKEVAKEMDMSVSAVKVSAHRTSNKLKELLE